VIFEVCFARKDPIPMDEVTKRPTATEVDDYSEYKRLRKLHREGKRKVHETTGTALATFQQPVKAAPQIMPLMPVPPRLTPRGSPSPSRKPTFKRPHFDIPEDMTPDLPSAGMSPRTIGETDYFRFSPVKSSTLLVPTRSSIRPSNHHSADASPTVTPVMSSPGTASLASSNNTRGSGQVNIPEGGQANIQEVAPWVELDAESSVPSSDDTAPSDIKSNGTLSPGTADNKHLRRRHSPTSTPRRDRRKSGDVSLSSKSKDSRKSIFVRSRNPMAKLFDGAASEYDEGDFANAMDETASSLRRKEQRSEDVHVYSPVPIRLVSFATPESGSPVKMKRRGAVYTSVDGSEDLLPVGAGSDDPFVDDVSTRALAVLPNLNFSKRPRGGLRSASPADRKAMGWGSNIVFRNPFVGFNEQQNGMKDEDKGSEEVAPDIVC
jgi:putative methyltransferase